MTFRWRKLGRVFDPTGVGSPQWIAEFAQGPATIDLGDRIRVYFSCRPPREADGMYTSTSTYLEVARDDVTQVLHVADKPLMPLGDRGTFDEFGIYPTSVIHTNEGYLAYYAGWTRCESVPFNTAIGMATSDDGIAFKKLGPGPVIEYSPDEPFVISGPKIRRFGDQYWLFYIAGRKWVLDQGRPEPVYKIRAAVSDDGIHWQKLHRDLIESRIEVDEAQASPDVFYKDGCYHMMFCYRHSTNYRNGERGYRIGYARSENLTDWVRNDGEAGIEVSAEGWDAEMVSYPHVFELDGTWYLYYLGNEVGRFGFGAAVLETS